MSSSDNIGARIRKELNSTQKICATSEIYGASNK
jgi:hypothetical protein